MGLKVAFLWPLLTTRLGRSHLSASSGDVRLVVGELALRMLFWSRALESGFLPLALRDLRTLLEG